MINSQFEGWRRSRKPSRRRQKKQKSSNDVSKQQQSSGGGNTKTITTTTTRTTRSSAPTYLPTVYIYGGRRYDKDICRKWSYFKPLDRINERWEKYDDSNYWYNVDPNSRCFYFLPYDHPRYIPYSQQAGQLDQQEQSGIVSNQELAKPSVTDGTSSTSGTSSTEDEPKLNIGTIIFGVFILFCFIFLVIYFRRRKSSEIDTNGTQSISTTTTTTNTS